MLSPASQADRVAGYAPLVLALLAAQLGAAEIPQLVCIEQCPSDTCMTTLYMMLHTAHQKGTGPVGKASVSGV